MLSKGKNRVGLGSSWMGNHSRKVCREKPVEIEERSDQRRKVHLNDHEVSE